MDLAIRQFLEEAPAGEAPPGTRAIYVPAELPDDLAGLLERAGREMVDDLGQGLDTAAMAMKRAKIR